MESELANSRRKKLERLDRKTYIYKSDMDWSEVVDNLCYYPRFRERLVEQLNEVPFQRYKWECNPFNPKKDSPFEFVCVSDTSLPKKPDPSKLLDYITDAEVAVYKNLKKTSTLISPGLLTNADCATISSFMRTAKAEDQHALLIALGKELEKRKKPVWVSTAGAAVPWLHIRLDPRAKYYKHKPYIT
jgi:hypothetical protein